MREISVPALSRSFAFFFVVRPDAQRSIRANLLLKLLEHVLGVTYWQAAFGLEHCLECLRKTALDVRV
jgi:hypothetical protein